MIRPSILSSVAPSVWASAYLHQSFKKQTQHTVTPATKTHNQSETGKFIHKTFTIRDSVFVLKSDTNLSRSSQYRLAQTAL
jgi:hypothetical protein